MRRAAVVAVALLGASCYATHVYREIREAPARAVPAPWILPVRVAMAAGELRLGRAAGDAQYELRVRYCRSHFTPRIATAVDGLPAVEAGLRRRPGGRPAVPVDADRNSIELGLDPKVAADIRLDLGTGRHRAHLGGLRIAGLQASCGAGDLEIDFATPALEGPDEMRIEGGSGRVAVRGLGHAGAGAVTVRGGSGSIGLDLAGSWTRDATITIDARLADVVVEVPGGLAVAVTAEGRAPADLEAPGFRRDPEGRWITPGFPGTGRRVAIGLLPGIGRFEARIVAGGSKAR